MINRCTFTLSRHPNAAYCGHGWRKVDLSSLGAVDKLVFKAVCDYLADPTYFCVDEIGLLKPDAM